MAKETLRVVARIVAKPEKVEDLKATLSGLIAPTRKEKGCISYELLQNKADPADFTFVEEWDDDACLNTHLETEHLKQALARFPELTAVAPDIRRYRLIA